jgi:uncharacterized protein (DUF302 family)
MGVIVAIGLAGLAGAQVMAIDGLTTIKSEHGPEETMRRLKAAVIAKGMTVFARIDHAAAAADVEMKLRPTDLLIFGSPKGGTPVMWVVQTIGIDLPLKALVWQDEVGITWLSYNQPASLVARHGADIDAKAVHAMALALEAVAAAATSSHLTMKLRRHSSKLRSPCEKWSRPFARSIGRVDERRSFCSFPTRLRTPSAFHPLRFACALRVHEKRSSQRLEHELFTLCHLIESLLEGGGSSYCFVGNSSDANAIAPPPW